MAKKKMSKLDWLAITLLLIGGLNWGLTSNLLFNFNLVEKIFGTAFLANLIYLLVGASAVYSAIKLWFFK